MSGRLRMLIDSRRVNDLLNNDYLKTSFSISNTCDALNYSTCKKLFAKLDCSQAYHCALMAHNVSVQLLAFTFASRAYAHKYCMRPVQELKRTVTRIISFIRQYLDPCLALGNCTHFLFDIVMAVTNIKQLLLSLREIHICKSIWIETARKKSEMSTDIAKFLRIRSLQKVYFQKKTKITTSPDKSKIPKQTSK